jgi:menaquinone-dependent protoporphyrinogen oxidase
MPVRVITASKHASTREVGETIAARLRERGLEAVAADAEGGADLPSGDPVVLGSPIYMGRWMKPARAVALALASEPPGRPLWMFTVGPLGDPPEPADAKPDDEIERIAGERARGHRLFTGRLDREQLNRRERLAVRAVKAPEGDFRDWDAIEAWADEIAAHLSEAGEARSDADG